MSTETAKRSTYVAIRTTDTERKIIHDVARAHGYGSLSDFTRDLWVKAMTGSKPAQHKPTQDPQS